MQNFFVLWFIIHITWISAKRVVKALFWEDITHQATCVAVAAAVTALVCGRRYNLTRSGNFLPIFEIIINYCFAGGMVGHPVLGYRALALQHETITTSLLCHGLRIREYRKFHNLLFSYSTRIFILGKTKDLGNELTFL